jgi:hypothetical protein
MAAALLLTGAAVGVGRASAPCPNGGPAVGDLGIVELSGVSRFVIRQSADGQGGATCEREVQFRAEPRLLRIDPAGPAARALREGDVLIAVDGMLITTRAGARRFANLDAGRPVRLTLRRQGRVLEARLVPRIECAQLPPAWIARAREPVELSTSVTVQSPEESPEAPTAPPRPPIGLRAMKAPPPRPEDLVTDARRTEAASRLEAMMAQRGWFGMAFDCSDCHWEIAPGDSGVLWSSEEYPVVYNVDSGGPADRAGLRRGDVLTEIDGLSLIRSEGGRRLGAVRPGQVVRWSYRRDGRPGVATATAAARPGPLGDIAQEMARMRRELAGLQRADLSDEAIRRRLNELVERSQSLASRSAPSEEQRLRYSGVVGDAAVTVRGLGSVTVSTDPATGELVITTSDASVRIKPDPRKPPRR